MTQFLFLLLLIILIGLFIWGRWRYDIVAFLGLIVAALIGLVPYRDVFSGFGHPATILVACVLIMSSALGQAGVSERLAKYILPFCRHLSFHILALSMAGALLSAFINNIGALAVLMPVAIETAKHYKRSPSAVLMPLSFSCILGGMTTLIGTPPNMIISKYRGDLFSLPFSMFDFTVVGASIAVLGVCFISFIGWRFLSVQTRTKKTTLDIEELKNYMSQFLVSSDSSITGLTVAEIYDKIKALDVGIVGAIRGKRRYTVIPKTLRFKTNDILIIEAEQEEVTKFMTYLNLKPIGQGAEQKTFLQQKNMSFQEAVVQNYSRIEGRQLKRINLLPRLGVSILGISRHGRPYRGRLRDFRFRVGDILLFYGRSNNVDTAIKDLQCLPLRNTMMHTHRKMHFFLSLGIFFLAVCVSVLGIYPLQISMAVAVILVVLFDIISYRNVYKLIDGPVIVLIAAMIPLGEAMQSTGTAALLVDTLLKTLPSTNSYLVLGVVILITMTLSDVLNNAATAVLMAPIAATLASSLSLSVDSLLMGVAIGSSCAFLTPIGHQNNAIILGAGGYDFKDFWRMGLPVQILVLIIAVPMILWYWT